MEYQLFLKRVTILIMLSVAFQLVYGQHNTITVASWNMKNFGQTKLNDEARLSVIVDVLKKYDVVACQEIKDKTKGLPSVLISRINSDGSNYGFIESERVGRRVQESYLIIYDKDKVSYVPNSMGFITDFTDDYEREPFYAMFRAGNFDFYLMTIHTKPRAVDEEIPALARDYVAFQCSTENENDIILLGDLNARATESPYKSYTTLDSMDSIPGIKFTILGETNTKGGKSYDNIIFQENHTREYADSAGVDAFWEDFDLSVSDGFKISDHRPVYVLFYTDLEDDD
jgi:endonuclease/exonuclease/phosphatase family metal-dependent hydrolase